MTADDSLPWTALYRRALAAGIEDAAFWRMSPAALLALARGAHRRGAPLRMAARDGAPGQAARVIGSLTDCP